LEVNSLDSEWPYFHNESLNEWDTSVLKVIGNEGLIRFTFDGMKRRLGVHPETLSRVLSRLEDQGIIEKQNDGYRVKSEARKALNSQPMSNREPGVPLLQTLLPSGIAIKEMVTNLKGKWFGALRWLGYAEGGEAIILKWITEDGEIQVDAAFSEGSLSIEAKMLSEENLSEALMASYRLISYIFRIYERSGRIQHADYTSFGSDPTIMWM
jgi:DNA-binding transcriptional ArsR family regulator